MNGPWTKKKNSDVIVIGSGPLGWACAQILSRNKVKTTLIDSKNPSNPDSWLNTGLGVFWPSLNDPPTRSVVAHGSDMAHWLQNFCIQGLQVVQSILGEENLISIPAFRVGIEKHETLELKFACESSLGIQQRREIGENYFSEKQNSFIINPKNNLNKRFSKNPFISAKTNTVKKLIDSIDGCQVFLDDGSILQSEIVILATGYKISTFESWLSPMLVPMSDVISNWITNIPALQNAKPFTLRTSSGHVAALLLPILNKSNQFVWSIKLTGPRFILPASGVGIDLSGQVLDPLLPQKIEFWIKENIIPRILPLIDTDEPEKFKNKQFLLELKSISYGVDCLPCDELPMLGELGTQGRILGGTGWLGCGWSAGFQAGQILSELVLSGSSTKLRGLLRPQRWRSGLNNSNESGVTGMT